MTASPTTAPTGTFVGDGGYLFLGQNGLGGENDVYDSVNPLGSANRLVYNDSCTGICPPSIVYAEQTWWGAASGPPAGAFTGSVEEFPFRTTPATSGNRAAGSPVLAAADPSARAAARGVAPRGDPRPPRCDPRGRRFRRGGRPRPPTLRRCNGSTATTPRASTPRRWGCSGGSAPG